MHIRISCSGLRCYTHPTWSLLTNWLCASVLLDDVVIKSHIVLSLLAECNGVVDFCAFKYLLKREIVMHHASHYIRMMKYTIIFYKRKNACKFNGILVYLMYSNKCRYDCIVWLLVFIFYLFMFFIDSRRTYVILWGVRYTRKENPFRFNVNNVGHLEFKFRARFYSNNIAQ